MKRRTIYRIFCFLILLNSIDLSSQNIKTTFKGKWTGYNLQTLDVLTLEFVSDSTVSFSFLSMPGNYKTCCTYRLLEKDKLELTNRKMLNDISCGPIDENTTKSPTRDVNEFFDGGGKLLIKVKKEKLIYADKKITLLQDNEAGSH